jgi:hypothetical protein
MKNYYIYDYIVPYLDKNWQFLKFHTGMCTFGSQSLAPKVCEYIKSGHTFGCHAVKHYLKEQWYDEERAGVAFLEECRLRNKRTNYDERGDIF